LLLATTAPPVHHAHAARRAQRSPRAGEAKAVDGAQCAGAYVVKRKPLVGSATAKGSDAVVLEVAGPAEGTPPLVTVRSGCATAPATLAVKRGGTIVTAELSSCDGVPGTAHLRAVIDARCRKMKGRLRGPRDGKGPRVRRFTARREQMLLNGRISGRVSARHGAEDFVLPGVSVFLRRRPDAAATASVESDLNGNFALSEQPAGTYDVCASADGFAPTCASEPIELGAGASEYREIELTPVGGAVHGRVLLADGTPCYQPPTPLDGGVAATVTRTGGTTSHGNTAARYLLAGLPGAGTYTLDASCGASHAAIPITVGAAELDGTRPVDLTVPNSPPSITLLAATMEGVGVRSAVPGSILDVSADVADADGDTLHYAWVDDQGGVTTVDAPVARWTLQPVTASNVLNLLVSDGKGGYASRQLVVRGGDPIARFGGHVNSRDGTALAHASVSVDGVGTTTDEGGYYRIDVPRAEQHVLTVKAAGHAPYSRTYDDEILGLEVKLAPARRYVVDPTGGFEIKDGDTGHVLGFPAGVLVDADGNPPTGPVTVEVYTYDRNLGEFPGDRVAAGPDGELHGLNLETCLWVAVIGADGRRLQLTLEGHVDVSFKVPSSLSDDPPDTLALMRFDEASGRWIQDAVAVHADDRYKAQVTSLQPVGVAIFPDQGDACLRLDVDDNQLERPFRLLVSVGPTSFPGTGTILTDMFVQETTSVISGLPANQFATLVVRPLSDTDKILAVTVAPTGPNVKPATPTFPYSRCQRVTLRTVLPTNHWLDHIGTGIEQWAQEYYQRIGAYQNRATFQQWLDANEFEPGHTVNDVVFFNKNELGLARRLNCRRRNNGGAPIIGCYVTKFGEVGGNPDQMLADGIDQHSPGDTVAMEVSPGPDTPERNTKFFIYGPDGNLKTKTAFDTQGYTKFVPTVCEYCHSERYDLGGNLVDLNGQFVTLDPFEYKFMPSGPYSLDSQQERLRQLNEIISFGERHTGA